MIVQRTVSGLRVDRSKIPIHFDCQQILSHAVSESVTKQINRIVVDGRRASRRKVADCEIPILRQLYVDLV